MDKQKLELLLRGHPWQGRTEVYDTVASTNTLLKEKAKKGAPEGAAIIAEEQTAGRGRLGRSFLSQRNAGLYFSLLLRPEKEERELMTLTARAAVCAAEAIRTVCNVRPGIKWVNDLLINGRKICGILTELVTAPEGVAAIVGIGINCSQNREDFPEELRDIAGSVYSETGVSPDREALAAELLWELSRIWESERMDDYRAQCITVGKRVTVLRSGASQDSGFGTAELRSEDSGFGISDSVPHEDSQCLPLEGKGDRLRWMRCSPVSPSPEEMSLPAKGVGTAPAAGGFPSLQSSENPPSAREGTALAVTETGALVVRFDDGAVEEIFTGEVSVKFSS